MTKEWRSTKDECRRCDRALLGKQEDIHACLAYANEVLRSERNAAPVCSTGAETGQAKETEEMKAAAGPCV